MSEVNMRRINIDEISKIAKNTNVKIEGFQKGKKGTHVLVSCKSGHEYSQRLDAFKISKGCKYCSRKAKYTYKEVKEYIEKFNYKLLSDKYIGIDSNLEVECPQGHIFSPTFHNFLHNASRCPTCNGGLAHTYEYVKNRIESKGFVLLSKEYVNSKTELLMKCPNGHILKQSFENFKLERSCKFCNNSTRKFIYEYVKGYIESFNYTLISTEYINKDSLLTVKCEKGHEYTVSFHNFKAGYRCPMCNSSKGEKVIEDILKKYGIVYLCEYKFDDCKYKSKLPFDFYIPSLNTCIEYDGIQHFVPIEHFGGKNKFRQTNIRDKIKTDYCLNKGITLIRIPYWDYDNIEQILLNELRL